MQLANGFETLTTKYFADVNALYHKIGYVPPWDHQLSKLKLEIEELRNKNEELEGKLKRDSVGKKETLQTAMDYIQGLMDESEQPKKKHRVIKVTKASARPAGGGRTSAAVARVAAPKRGEYCHPECIMKGYVNNDVQSAADCLGDSIIGFKDLNDGDAYLKYKDLQQCNVQILKKIYLSLKGVHPRGQSANQKEWLLQNIREEFKKKRPAFDAGT
eukprot:SAG31_NODE_6244_length_2104_cov_2.144140_2_plen_216_part_00